MTQLLSVNMGLVGDVILAVILLIFAFATGSRGFMRSLVGFLGTVLSVVLAVVFSKTIASYFQEWFGLLDKFTNFFTDLLSKIEILNVDVSGNVTEGLQNAGIPEFMIKIIVSAFAGGETIKAGTTAAQVIAPLIGQLLLLLISFVLIFTIIKVLELILNGTISKAVETIPVVKSVNSMLGFILGAIEGLFFAYFILYVFSLFQIEVVTNFINSTTFIKVLYDNNLFGWFAKWVVSSDWIIDYLTGI